jgi:NAD(P)-dependent dehydrogenase (short-subunit alcohol dehydrogenase family)
VTGRPVALVTGASRGIGRAAVLALADQGYDVVVNYSGSASAAQQVAAQARHRGAMAVPRGGGGRGGRAPARPPPPRPRRHGRARPG